MAEERKEPEEERAEIRKQLSDDTQLDADQATDEASLAPPGHLGERMNEPERRERGG
jgi:hypothetical protein